MRDKTRKEDWIRRRADELWNQEGRRPESEQACWDKAVQEYEAASSEDDRGPARPGPRVGSAGNTRP